MSIIPSWLTLRLLTPATRKVPQNTFACQVAVRVTPNCSREAVQIDSAEVRVKVSAPPVDGKANAAVADTIEDCFAAVRGRVADFRIVSGGTNKSKVVGFSFKSSESALDKVAIEVTDLMKSGAEDL